MILIDTSVWINLFRDKSGLLKTKLKERLGAEDYAICHIIQSELLQGARDDLEWQRLSSYLENQIYLPVQDSTWPEAARIYYDLRRKGLTISGFVDCMIAQIAQENSVLLLHSDHDFEKVAKIRRFAQEYFSPASVIKK
jgi:hypothetical protein